LQDYDFILWNIPEKMNTRVNILSRKDQVNMKNDNKNINILKNKLWTRKISTEAKITILKGNQIVKETTLLEEIQKNNMREQEVQKKLKKENGQT